MSAYRASYRKLLKTAIYVFGKDYQMIDVARKTMKEEFRRNMHVTDPAALQKCFQDAEEAEHMLRYEILQGVKNQKGNFEVKFTPENQEAIAADQHLRHGPEISPIDRSYIGEEVVITKSGGKPASSASSACEDKTCTDKSHAH